MLKLLSKEDMDQIHRATVKVLEKTGVQFRRDEALNILEENGAIVDRKTKIAKIPEACSTNSETKLQTNCFNLIGTVREFQGRKTVSTLRLLVRARI